MQIGENMAKRVKSNLKEIMDSREIKIRQLEAMTKLDENSEPRVKFETIRRLYHDTTMQYQRDSIGILCEVLDIELSELLILVDKEDQTESKNK